MSSLLRVLLWLLHTTRRLVRKPEFADLTSCHHFWLFRKLEARRVTPASSVSLVDGREIYCYRHVIGGLVGKSRVCRNCPAGRTAHGRHQRDDGAAPLPAGRTRRPLPREIFTDRRPHRSPAPAADASPAETVEFPVSDAAEKSTPLRRREYQDRPSAVPAVTDAHLATGQAGHLDTIAVGVTQRALHPVRT